MFALGTAYYLYGPGLLRKTVVSPVLEQQAVGAKLDIPEVNLLERPAEPGAHMSDIAYRALFGMWHIPYSTEDGSTICEQAREQGLQCAQGRGSINDLRQINKPAVLKLLDPRGDEYYVALISLHEDDAGLLINNQTKTIPIGELAKWWSGEYLLLWKTPPDYKDQLKPGEHGSFVAWVDRHLAQAQGRPAHVGGTLVYNEEMVRQVKEFQRIAGLTPDGIVGPWTTMRLSAIGSSRPALDGRQGGN
jgi:general secretion pathway protein A